MSSSPSPSSSNPGTLAVGRGTVVLNVGVVEPPGSWKSPVVSKTGTNVEDDDGVLIDIVLFSTELDEGVAENE